MNKYFSYIGIFLIGLVIGIGIVFNFPKVKSVMGSGNITLMTSVQKADICKVSVTSSTVLCYFQNLDADGFKRVVRDVTFYSDSLGFASTASLTVGTSTAITSTTNSASLWVSTGLTSTTIQQYLTTTTYGTVANRLWQNGSIVSVNTTNPVTTTGFIEIRYDKVPLQ